MRQSFHLVNPPSSKFSGVAVKGELQDGPPLPQAASAYSKPARLPSSSGADKKSLRYNPFSTFHA
jgi:hypothetical protein